MSVKLLLKELYWIGIFLLSSYLVIALNSSFNLSEPMRVCAKSSAVVSKFYAIIQLSFLLIVTKALFYYILKIENSNIRYFMVPIVLFAFPVSIIALWLQWMGC